jgi:hypothetical protein
MTKLGEMAEEGKKAAELAQKLMLQAFPIIDGVRDIVDRVRAKFEKDQLQIRFDICGIEDVLVLHFDMTDENGNLKAVKWNTVNTETLFTLLEKFADRQRGDAT